MMKLLGSVLVASAAAYLGFRAADRLRNQVRGLDELIGGLGLMEQEMELSAPELGELMRCLSQRARGAARVLFSDFARGLEGLDGGGPGQLWEGCVASLEGLSSAGKSTLAPLGEILGRYDSREQCACIAAVRKRLEALREEEAAQCREKCRACQTIGLSGGAFLIVLLL